MNAHNASRWIGIVALFAVSVAAAPLPPERVPKEVARRLAATYTGFDDVEPGTGLSTLLGWQAKKTGLKIELDEEAFERAGVRNPGKKEPRHPINSQGTVWRGLRQLAVRYHS